MQDHGGENVVTVSEDVRLDRDEIAGDAFGRKAAVVDRRRHSFNDDTASTIKTGSGHEGVSCELYALFQRGAGGQRIMQFEQQLLVTQGREDVFVAGGLANRLLEERPRILPHVLGGNSAVPSD